jgi:hypothetical protein
VIRNTYTEIGTEKISMTPAQKLGRNIICPGAKWEEKSGKGGRKRERRKALANLHIFKFLSL